MYLALFINIILELAYNAWRDSTRDARLRTMLEAHHAELDTIHDIRQKLADAVQPEVELNPSPEADAVHTDARDAG
jgi:hypothetical protein